MKAEESIFPFLEEGIKCGVISEPTIDHADDSIPEFNSSFSDL